MHRRTVKYQDLDHTTKDTIVLALSRDKQGNDEQWIRVRFVGKPDIIVHISQLLQELIFQISFEN